MVGYGVRNYFKASTGVRELILILHYCPKPLNLILYVIVDYYDPVHRRLHDFHYNL